MGCGGSRLGGGGKTAAFLPRLRPLFLSRRSPPKLLLHEDESCSASPKYGTPLSGDENWVFGRKYEQGNSKVEIEAGFRENRTASRDESEFEDALSDAYEEEEEEEEDEDRMRMIGNEDDGAFPGSPTFRYFCKDGDADDLGKIDAISSDDDDVSPKENYNEEKKAKRGRKRRSFKKVAAMKKLFNVKACYPQSSSTRHHDSHLLVGNTIA